MSVEDTRVGGPRALGLCDKRSRWPAPLGGPSTGSDSGAAGQQRGRFPSGTSVSLRGLSLRNSKGVSRPQVSSGQGRPRCLDREWKGVLLGENQSVHAAAGRQVAQKTPGRFTAWPSRVLCVICARPSTRRGKVAWQENGVVVLP